MGSSLVSISGYTNHYDHVKPLGALFTDPAASVKKKGGGGKTPISSTQTRRTSSKTNHVSLTIQ
jgi:hypothetical protein